MVMHIKTPKIVRTLMESKMALYVLVALSVMNVLGYMMNNCARAVVFFFLVGAVAYGFTHNMVVILSSALVFTTILVTCGGGSPLAHNSHHYVEGMQGKDESKDSEHSDDKDDDGGNSDDASNDSTTGMATGDDANAKKEPTGATAAPAAAPADKKCAEGQKMNKEGTCVDAMTTVYKKNNRIDAAATVEDAYDDLNKILGSDGMKNLTKDTQSLVSQQKDLTEAMKGMGPLVEQASSMMKQMGGTAGIGSMLKKFGGDAAPVGKTN